MQLSTNGAAQLSGLEGVIIRCYKDPGGVPTVGPGFTWGSKVFRDYWLATRHTKLKVGDEMTMDEAVALLPKVFDEEYGAAVTDKIHPKTQWHYDGAGSVAYNAGTGSLVWKWAIALRDGLVAKAGELLLTTAITVNGRPLEGLRRRRRIEANTITTGHYTTTVGMHLAVTAEEIKTYQQQLYDLGYFPGPIDGRRATSDEAVRRFQADNKLRVDGDVGPATRSALARRVLERTRTGAAGVGGLGGAGSGAAMDPSVMTDGVNHNLDSWLPILLTGAGVVVVVFIVFWAWSNRGIITGRRTPA